MVPLPSNSIVPESDVGKIPVLDTRNLGIEFGGLKAVDDFTITVGRTEISGLIGPNGAGKTTVFNLITNVYQPTHGAILLDGIDTKGKSVSEVNRMGIARTFQNIRLFGKMSVADNIKVALSNQDGMKCSLASSLLRLPQYHKSERAVNERTMELLGIFGMQDLAKHEAGSLPYGMQRRLEILRALATSPKILLLDEPRE